MELDIRELEEILSGIMQPNGKRPWQLTPIAINKLLAKLKGACRNVIERLNFFKFNNTPDSGAVSSAKKFQICLTVLIDRVSENEEMYLQQIKSIAEKKRLSIFFKAIQSELFLVFQYFKQRLFSYFDLDASLPIVIAVKHEVEIVDEINIIRNKLIAIALDPHLIEIIISPFEKIIKKSKLSYRAIYFLQSIKEGIDDSTNTTDVLQALLKLNFNSQRFFNYYIEKIKPVNETEMPVAELIVYYTYELKLINQVAMNKNSGLHSDTLSLRDQLVSWLAEEIYFLEKKLSLLPGGINTKVLNTEPSDKVLTNLSVSNLSLALKLLLDTGIIRHKNVTELIRNVSRTFRTEKSETISEDSLRNKAYSYEKRSVKEMKDVMIQLMNKLRTYD
ncbi:MAG: hypothetical protein JST81_14515 [Bacteroidetes bacterium]|nr:hypothetical protein [Bacteroidota bacterium]